MAVRVITRLSRDAGKQEDLEMVFDVTPFLGSVMIPVMGSGSAAAAGEAVHSTNPSFISFLRKLD